MKTKIQRPVKNECDKQIETRSRSHALDFVAAAAQILTILCIVKGNPASEALPHLYISMMNTKKKHISSLESYWVSLEQPCLFGLELPDKKAVFCIPSAGTATFVPNSGRTGFRSPFRN